MKTIYLSGKEKNEVRRLLRNLLKANRLEARQTYYDYYDSCHAPVETPNADWKLAVSEYTREYNQITIQESDLKAGGMGIALIEPGIWKLFTSYKTLEVRIKKC